MTIPHEKITGYILLLLGVFLIIGCAFSIYLIFTGQATPVKVFNFPSVSVDFTQAISASLPTQLKVAPKAATPTELISGATMSATANLVAHLLLLGFLVNVGFKLASLGTQLLRPIIIHGKHVENNGEKSNN